ncbi:MAG: hypothetical protein ACKOJF_20640, partial [Planctomycetaceae bacterium]
MRRCLALACLCLVLLSSRAGRGEDHPTQLLQATAKIWHSGSAATAFFLLPETGVDPAARECLLVTAAHFLEPSPEPQIGLLLRAAQPD